MVVKGKFDNFMPIKVKSVRADDDFVIFELDEGTKPDRIYLQINSGLLYYGNPMGSNIRIRDGKYLAVVIYNMFANQIDRVAIDRMYKKMINTVK